MEKIIETERLILRRLTLHDSAFIIELLNTEGWIKYIGNRNVTTEEQAREYLINGPITSYTVNGFGLYLLQLKDGTPAGMCGLIKRDHLPFPDIGYALLPQYNGNGYAFEIASAVLQYAFSKLNMQKVLAITLPENRASVKLLQKLGMKYEETFIDTQFHESLDRYGITKNDIIKLS